MRPIVVLVLALVAGAVRAFPLDSEVREMLRHRVEVSRRAPGMVVAMADASGPRVVAYGKVLCPVCRCRVTRYHRSASRWRL